MVRQEFLGGSAVVRRLLVDVDWGHRKSTRDRRDDRLDRGRLLTILRSDAVDQTTIHALSGGETTQHVLELVLFRFGDVLQNRLAKFPAEKSHAVTNRPET